MEENPKEDWVQVPHSKSSFGGYLKGGGGSNLLYSAYQVTPEN